MSARAEARREYMRIYMRGWSARQRAKAAEERESVGLVRQYVRRSREEMDGEVDGMRPRRVCGVGRTADGAPSVAHLAPSEVEHRLERGEWVTFEASTGIVCELVDSAPRWRMRGLR